MQPNKVFIGGDPGLTGGLLSLDHKGDYLGHLQYPLISEGSRVRKVRGANQKQDINGINCVELARILKGSLGITPESQLFISIEKVWLMKGQGISTGSTFMDNYGRLKAIISCFLGGYTLVTPKVWQVALFGKQEYTKALGKQFTVDNLKDYKKLIPVGCRSIPDGLSDAYCITEYRRRLNE